MQTLTFTQKLLRQRHFFSSLIPLLALFVGLGASQSAFAQDIKDDAVTFAVQPTGAPSVNSNFKGRAIDAPYNTATYTPLGNTSSSPVVNPPFLGTYDLDGNSALTLTGADVTASMYNVDFNPNPATSARTIFRVFLTSSTPAQIAATPFTQVAMSLTGPLASRPSANLFQKSDSPNNLLFGLSSGGGYTIQIQFQTYDASGSLLAGDVPTYYTATFAVTPPANTPPGGSTTWISDGVPPKNNDWLNSNNWSNGVPNRFSDAVIPEKLGAGQGTFTITPALEDPTATYAVRNLSLNGTSNSSRALLRIGSTTGGASIGATLNAYGDLNVFGGGILAATNGTAGRANPSTNSTIALLGNNDQTIRGLLTIVDLRIEGSGFKNIVNSIVCTNTFSFAPGTTGVARTVFENTGTTPSTFSLNTTKTSSLDLGATGNLFGETNDAYVRGIVVSARLMTAGVQQTFGNIGIDITTNRDVVGSPVTITRTIGDPLNGPVGRNAAPIKRQYGVSGDINTAAYTSTVVFHYLSSTDELNGNLEPNLALFRTGNNGVPYAFLGGTLDIAAKTVTKSGLNAVNTLTLGDRLNPLPVSLASFEAKRVGNDAVLDWQTAAELNNLGFNVQVSTDGKEFRTIGFVKSQSPNSVQVNNYTYTDTEKNKVGLRYYRLEQVDVDNKTAYFTPRVVTFGKADAALLLAYPNPFTRDIRFNVQSTIEGQARVVITDITGRTIALRQVALSPGSNDFPLENLGALTNGIYLVRITLPSGITQSLKVVKN